MEARREGGVYVLVEAHAALGQAVVDLHALVVVIQRRRHAIRRVRWVAQPRQWDVDGLAQRGDASMEKKKQEGYF